MSFLIPCAFPRYWAFPVDMVWLIWASVVYICTMDIDVSEWLVGCWLFCLILSACKPFGLHDKQSKEGRRLAMQGERVTSLCQWTQGRRESKMELVIYWGQELRQSLLLAPAQRCQEAGGGEKGASASWGCYPLRYLVCPTLVFNRRPRHVQNKRGKGRSPHCDF